MIQKFRDWGFMMWRPVLAAVAVALIFASVLGFQLGSLTKNASISEQTYVSSIKSGKQLLRNPVYAVHKLPTYALSKLKVNNLAAYRAVSAAFATLAAVSLFFILREWYTDRVAALGTTLFLASAWTLHIGRLATPESSYLLVLPLIWTVVWLFNTTLRRTSLLLLSFLAAVGFYVPGLGLLIVLAAAWKHKHLWNELKHVPRWFWAVCAATALATLMPLMLASVGDAKIATSAIGLPQSLPTLTNIGQNILSIPEYLLFRGPADPTRWLGRLPILDVFAGVMMIIGIYSLRYHLKHNRVQLLAGGSIVIIILIALGGEVTITALMPIVYILVAAGIAFMLQQWFTVFPNNPVARTLATTLLSSLVLFVSYYHITHYFIAWPQTPVTKSTFNKTLVK